MNKSYLAVLISVLSFIYTHLAFAYSVEWAPYIKKGDVKESALIMAANQVNKAFLAKQSGFIKRELVKKSEREYADIVYWQTQKEAETASEKAMKSIICLQYFSLMEMEQSAGAGFAHYQVLKTWQQ